MSWVLVDFAVVLTIPWAHAIMLSSVSRLRFQRSSYALYFTLSHGFSSCYEINEKCKWTLSSDEDGSELTAHWQQPGRKWATKLAGRANTVMSEAIAKRK